MATPRTIVDAAGRWVGRSKLYLPFMPPEEQITESDSELVIEAGLRAHYGKLSYTWHYDGEDHVGDMVICESRSGRVTAGWSDSWHQNGSVMEMNGTSGALVAVTGHYGAKEGDNDWGWRFEVELMEDESLELRMTNIHPDGTEEWAVAASYRRSASG